MTEAVSPTLLRHPHAPLIAFGVLLVATFGLLGYEAARLPQTVATHFDGAGQPDAWLPLAVHLTWSLIFGLLAPLIPAALVAACLRLIPRLINLPNRDYWLAPERRSETNRWLIRHMFWLACVLASVHLAVQGMIFAANIQSPPRLAGSMVLGLTGGILAAMATWMMVFWRRFARAPN